MLRGRHFAQAQAAGKAKRRQAAHEAHRARGYSAGSIFGSSEGGRRQLLNAITTKNTEAGRNLLRRGFLGGKGLTIGDLVVPLILVDTHVVIWLAPEPAGIAKKTRSAIAVRTIWH